MTILKNVTYNSSDPLPSHQRTIMSIGADIVTNDYFGPSTIQNHELTAQYLVDVSYSNLVTQVVTKKVGLKQFTRSGFQLTSYILPVNLDGHEIL